MNRGAAGMVRSDEAGAGDVEQRDAARVLDRGAPHQMTDVEIAVRLGRAPARTARRAARSRAPAGRRFDGQRRAGVDHLLIALGQRRRRHVARALEQPDATRRRRVGASDRRHVDVGQRGVARARRSASRPPSGRPDSRAARCRRGDTPDRDLVAEVLPDHHRREAADPHRRVGLDVGALVAVEDVGVEQVPAAGLGLVRGSGLT